jgi:hypothetical protein
MDLEPVRRAHVERFGGRRAAGSVRKVLEIGAKVDRAVVQPRREIGSSFIRIHLVQRLVGQQGGAGRELRVRRRLGLRHGRESHGVHIDGRPAQPLEGVDRLTGMRAAQEPDHVGSISPERVDLARQRPDLVVGDGRRGRRRSGAGGEEAEQSERDRHNFLVTHRTKRRNRISRSSPVQPASL